MYLEFYLMLRFFDGAGSDAADTGKGGTDDDGRRTDGKKGKADPEAEGEREQHHDPREQDPGYGAAEKAAFFMLPCGKISGKQRRDKKRAERERRRKLIRVVQ